MLRKFKVQDLGQWFLVPIAVTIPFGVSLGNIAIILTFIISIVLLFNTKSRANSWKGIWFIFPVTFFLLILLSAISGYNIDEGLKEVNKQALVLLLTIIILASPRFNSLENTVLLPFSYSTLLATGILLCYAIYRFVSTGNIELVYFHEFTLLYDQHPIYFSMYIALSTVVLLKTKFLKRLKPKNLALWSFMLVVLLVGLILCASKSVILIFVVLVNMLFLLYKKNKTPLYLLVAINASILFSLFSVSFIGERFSKDLVVNVDFSPTHKLENAKVFMAPEKEDLSDLELRYILHQIAIFHASNDGKLITGYGVGDLQDYLDYYYLWYGLAPNWYEEYNIHSQYLHILLSTGSLVLLVFLVYLGFSYIKAISNHNYLHLYFLLLVSFVFVIEVMLVRNKGIVFFFFFNTLFLKEYYLENRYTRV